MVTGQGAFPPKRTFKRSQSGLTTGFGVCYTQIAQIALATGALFLSTATILVAAFAQEWIAERATHLVP